MLLLCLLLSFNQVKLIGKIDLIFMIVIFSGLLIDLIWKSFSVSLWYADMLISVVLMCQILVFNYEAKQILSLTLIGDASNYKSTTFGFFKSVYFKIMDQFSNG